MGEGDTLHFQMTKIKFFPNSYYKFYLSHHICYYVDRGICSSYLTLYYTVFTPPPMVLLYVPGFSYPVLSSPPC